MRMASRYGHAWVSNYGASPSGIAAAEWRSTLAGLEPQQILAGFEADKLRGDAWPPSSTLFHAMCHNIPALADTKLYFRAWAGAESSRPTSGFARLVYNFLDVYRWRSAPFEKADKMLRDAYDMARQHVLAGGEIPAEPVAFIEAAPAKEHKPARPEVVAEHIAKLSALFHVEPESGEAA